VPSIHAADSRDLTAVLALLERLQLPTQGLPEHVDTLLVAEHQGRIIGSAGLECYSDGALLRSVAVALEYQCAGVGRTLVDAALDLAWSHGTQCVFLLTTVMSKRL
jgi:amino-acid N-acetyltransferase